MQEETGWEEYFDYIFPEDEAARPNLKLLQMAKLWRKQQETTEKPDTEADEGVGPSTSQAADVEEEGHTPPGTPPGGEEAAALPEDIDRDDSNESSSSSGSDGET